MTHPHHATPQSAATLARLELGATGVIVVRLKEQPIDQGDGLCRLRVGRGIYVTNEIVERKYLKDELICESTTLRPVGEWLAEKCPYKPGDIVAVKETWGYVHGTRDETGKDPDQIWYRADGTCRYVGYDEPWLAGVEEANSHVDRWKSPRSMPLEYCRTFLRATSVACKRMQDVTEEECRLYGATHDGWNTERQVFQSQLKAAWSANEFHWFVTAEKCNNAKGTT
jgi:hypothetical protein